MRVTIIILRKKRMKRCLNRLIFGSLLLFCILLNGCKKGLPKGVIKPAKMENVLYDYQVAQTMSGNLSYDDEYKKSLYIDYVFLKHHITQAQFDSSMIWYIREAEELTKIYEQVNKRLKDQQGALNHQIALRDRKPLITAQGDTVDIWYADRLYRLTDYPLSNKLEFYVPSDVNFEVYDAMVWQIRHTLLGKQSKYAEAVMSLSVCFENDSVISSVKHIKRSGITSIRLKSDSALKIREVRGFVYFNDRNNERASLLLDQISLTRYHETEQERKEILKKDSLRKETEVGKKVQLIEDTTSAQISAPTNKPPVRMTPQEMNHSRVKRP